MHASLNNYIFLLNSGDLLDLEDIGTAMKKQKQNAKKEKDASDRLTARDGGREMVTKLQRRALTKEGYRIIGTHSAVKLCRWTKVRTYVCIYVLFTLSCTCIHLCTFVCMYTCIPHTGMYVCMYVFTFVCTHDEFTYDLYVLCVHIFANV